MELSTNVALEQQIQQIANHSEVALTSFEALNAISTSEARWRELKERGKLARMYKTITGKNRKIEQAMNRDFITFQKCAQQSIELLAKRQVLTIDLLVMMQRGQHFYQAENNRKFQEINQFLKSFLSNTQQKMNELSARVDVLEKTQQLTTWKTTLKYQQIEGQPIHKLSNVEKVFYISSNFYRVTKGHWNNDQILLLETIIDDMHLHEEISFRQFLMKSFNKTEQLNHYFAVVSHYNVTKHQFIEGDLLFNLAAYHQNLVDTHDVLKLASDAKISLRELVFYFINGLAALETASKVKDVLECTDFTAELFLQELNPDDRIYVHGILKKYLKIPVEQCRELTQRVPVLLGRFEDLTEAQFIKEELEDLGCVVELK